ncbi:alcohol dehydrogenase [Macrophomina phaseolina]|uniref:Alcohol dehydrogenase n=1 Tax=Macrophomina phaseolina TaxID=35725 RepID=A0ABQ8FSW9_9PEZI|nr:alcohol dehydrogenase [Macrophomina phaseolina]
MPTTPQPPTSCSSASTTARLPADEEEEEEDDDDTADLSDPTILAWTHTTGGYPRCLALTHVPAPSASAPLSPTQLLVRVRAAALNPLDIQLMNVPLLWSLPYLSSVRKGIGADFAGEVLAAGRASGFSGGEEVFGIRLAGMGGGGTLQEVVTVDVGDGAGGVVVRKPRGWGWREAAAVPLAWLTARTCIAKCEGFVGEGEKGTVVVLGGSSAVGMWVVRLARRKGWRVVATCSARNEEFVREMGADVVVDYMRGGVRAAVEREAPDAVVDCVGGTECLGVARKYITIVGDKTDKGMLGGALTYLWNPQMVWRTLIGKLGCRSEVYECVNLELRKDYLEEALELEKDDIVIDSTFPFDRVEEALERLNSGRCRGKVVVEIGALGGRL